MANYTLRRQSPGGIVVAPPWRMSRSVTHGVPTILCSDYQSPVPQACADYYRPTQEQNEGVSVGLRTCWRKGDDTHDTFSAEEIDPSSPALHGKEYHLYKITLYVYLANLFHLIRNRVVFSSPYRLGLPGIFQVELNSIDFNENLHLAMRALNPPSRDGAATWRTQRTVSLRSISYRLVKNPG